MALGVYFFKFPWNGVSYQMSIAAESEQDARDKMAFAANEGSFDGYVAAEDIDEPIAAPANYLKH